MKKQLFFLMVGWISFLFSTENVLAQPDQTVQDTPFATLHLETCFASLHRHKAMAFGITTTPKTGWTLKDPKLIVTNTLGQKTTVATPFVQPFPSDYIYPFAFPATKSKEPVTYTVSGDWQACNDQTCHTQPVHLTLTLTSGLPIITPACNALTEAIQHVAIPMHAQMVSGTALKQSDKIQITLTFKTKPRHLLLYDINKQPLSVDFTQTGNTVSFILPASFVAKTKNLSLYAQTLTNFYQIDLPLSASLPPQPPTPPTKHAFIKALLLCLLCSPWLIFWARTPQKSTKDYRIQTKQALVAILCYALCSAMFVVLHFVYGWIIPSFSSITTAVLMTLGLILIPIHPAVAIVESIIVPMPYLTYLTHISPITWLFYILILTLILCSLFILQLKKQQQITHILKNKKYLCLVWWIPRLPWICFIIYVLCYL